MKIKKHYILLLILIFCFTFSELLPQMARAEAQPLTYETALRSTAPEKYRMYWTPHPDYSLENLNDGDPETIAQVEYHKADGTDSYNGDLLEDSFYILLDLGAVYDLDSIAICWYPKGGRSYKYNIEISSDDLTYQKAADHSENVTDKETITDSLSGQSGRYIRIEIFGNYRDSDKTHSEYFPTSEITVKGVLSDHQPEVTSSPAPDDNRLDYEITLYENAGNALNWTAVYPIENINDGDLSTVVQAVYNGWYDETNGMLDEPFGFILDLGAVYDLDRIQVDWFVKGDKYYMYKVLVSCDDLTYTLCADHADNTKPGTIVDSLEGVSARYIQFEILGNYMPKEQDANIYYAIYDLGVYGVYSADQPTERPATPTVQSTATPSPQQEQSPVPTGSASKEPTASAQTVPNTKKGNNGLYWGIGIGAVIIIAAGVAVCFILKKKRHT